MKKIKYSAKWNTHMIFKTILHFSAKKISKLVHAT